MAEPYVCTLDPETLAIAKDELNEDPKDRLGAVEALRTWALQQPHFTCLTDTPFLLRFLRNAKFSQLKAREKLENYTRAICKEARDWLADLDTTDPKIQTFIDKGLTFPLPGVDNRGCKVFLWRTEKTQELKEENKIPKMRSTMAQLLYMMIEERTQVRGVSYLCDMTGFTFKMLTFWTSEDKKKDNFLYEKALPGRYKAFYLYNIGPIFEVVVNALRPFYAKKVMDRMSVESTMEDVYKVVKMENLPDMYLPDDYKGPTAGSMQDIIKKLKKEMSEPSVRQRILDMTSSRNFSYDESKKIKDVPAESFRKLNVD